MDDLKHSPMMNHMLEALDRGEDIGHYGRLTFVMVARHRVDNEELVGLLTQDQDADERDVQVMVQQVEEKGYCCVDYRAYRGAKRPLAPVLNA
jgi:hypothetical protein